MLVSNSARAQQWKAWKTTTPRDTIYIHANQETPWTPISYTADCISTEFYFSGTFGVFPGKDSTEFDARYMFSDPSWPPPYPLANPPTWNGTNYQVYLEVTNDLNLSDADSVHVRETAYQPNHQYTAIYPGAGTFFEFRIYDQLNTQPNGSDYRVATGGITVRSAQYTAGISLKTNALQFPTTNVGTSSVVLDSIASYGIDPLQIDSVWIVGPQASSFSVVSQFGTHFTLNPSSTNQFAVSYTPSTPEITSTAWLILRSPNADCPHRLDTISLTGFSAAPNGTIGPSSLDFGLVRSGTSSSPKDAIASNSGNATYFITSDTIFPAVGTPPGVFTTTLVTVPPDPIYQGSFGQIQFNFHPIAALPYRATVHIWDSEGKLTAIILTGNGAAPHITASDSSLNFDTVFTDATKILYDTITNSGNWTAHVIIAELGCTNPNWFSFSPSDSNFYLDAGQSRIYAISFRPATTINTLLNACLEFYFDDGSQPEVIPLTGYEKQRTVIYDTNVVDFGHIKVGDIGKQSVGVENQSSRAANFNYSFDSTSTIFQLVGADSTTFNIGTDSLHLQFQPTYHGLAGTWMHLLCTTGQIDSIYMFGFGAIAQPVFSPDTINFGTCLDTTKNYFQIVVSDTGDYPLAICSLDIVGPDSSEFSLVHQPPFPYTVPDSGLGILTLGFNFTTNAHTGGVHRATLQIHYCDGSMDTLPMEGTEATASIQFTRAFPINFGNVRVNHSRDTGIGFANPENIAEAIDTIQVISAGPFFTKDITASVPASSYYYDSLIFAPTVRGHYKGWLYAGGGGMVDDSIQITGNGAQSIPVLSTHTINFVKTTLLQTSDPMTLALQDTGDWPLVTKIEKINDPDSEFTVVITNSGATVDTVADESIPVDSAATYSVTFTPRTPELPNHKSELVFHYDEGSPNDTVVLTGQDMSNFLAFDRDTINFGRVRVGTLSPTLSLGLLNTSSATLTASTITGPANQAGPTNQFSVTPNAPITVNSDDSAVLQVSFTPTAIGVAQSVVAGVGSPFNTSLRDSVVLVGLGSEPAPKLSVDTLFFDTVAWGRAITRSFSLADTGNWPLVVTCGGVTGPNATDFIPTPGIPAATTIDADSMAAYPVTFTATTPLQLTPRVAYITWTQDNGDTFRLVLIANDMPPLHVNVGFPHPYWGRPGDKIAAELDLQTAIPDSLGVNHIHGTVTWDPSIVFIPPGGGPTAGSMVAGWTTVITTPLGSSGGIFNYDISSDTGVLTTPGALLNLMFQLQMNLPEGASTPLTPLDTIPNNPEVVVSDEPTTIFLDSICGTIHLIDGAEPIASFIEQNIPNPLGAGASSTTLPFDVGSNNTIITIRLLDPTGREVLRPVDRQAFAQGRYQVTIDASSLHSGIYFYEFQADGQPPQMLKMSVE